MRLSFTAVPFGALLAVVNALTITSPSAGDNLDPTQPITVKWTSDSSDPSTFDLVLDNSNKYSLVKNQKVATSISTSSGSYILSTAAIMTYGDGFIFKAQGVSSNTLATSGSFSLAVDTSAVVTSSGRVSYQSTYTATAAASSASTGALAASTSAQTTSTSATASDSLVAQTTGTESTRSATSGPETTITSDGSSSRFTTSTTSRSSSSSSSTRSASSSAASATTSANAQPRIGSGGQIVLSAAGVIAGVVALLA